MPIRIVSPPLCPGFDMVRSGRVPSTIAAGLGFLACMNDILNRGGTEDFLHWAVHGEHAVLDALEESAGLPKELLARSRAKLRRRSRACCSQQRAGES
jgi:predicted naringenin-chalcone synthase